MKSVNGKSNRVKSVSFISLSFTLSSEDCRLLKLQSGWEELWSNVRTSFKSETSPHKWWEHISLLAEFLFFFFGFLGIQKRIHPQVKDWDGIKGLVRRVCTDLVGLMSRKQLQHQCMCALWSRRHANISKPWRRREQPIKNLLPANMQRQAALLYTGLTMSFWSLSYSAFCYGK